jgi:hypothetical protein
MILDSKHPANDPASVHQLPVIVLIAPRLYRCTIASNLVGSRTRSYASTADDDDDDEGHMHIGTSFPNPKKAGEAMNWPEAAQQ